MSARNEPFEQANRLLACLAAVQENLKPSAGRKNLEAALTELFDYRASQVCEETGYFVPSMKCESVMEVSA